MAVVHGQAAFSRGGVSGLQASQRDWSPFLVHLTSYQAMAPVRGAINAGITPQNLALRLADADSASFSVFADIAASRRLEARESLRREGVLPCVCLSECSLPGVIGMSERYGRFGFVFRKEALYPEGARPCGYMDDE